MIDMDVPAWGGGRAVVSLTQARKSYGGGSSLVTALAGVTVDFYEGPFTAIMGPSGSGKSTLLQCAAGLDRVDSGKVLLTGMDPRRLSRRALTELRRERVGFVFQSFNLMPSLTARQNVELPLRLAGKRPDPQEVAQALADVGLSDRAGHLPSQLSGGQQQRVAIARALVTDPDVLFADEPTGALDSSTSREVLGLLRRMVASGGQGGGQTVIMVTHDPLAASFADRVVFLADGVVTDEMAAPTAASVAARMAGLEAGLSAGSNAGSNASAGSTAC
jgi:putative ABC transport system ATP-binding protein